MAQHDEQAHPHEHLVADVRGAPVRVIQALQAVVLEVNRVVFVALLITSHLCDALTQRLCR